MGKRKKRLKRRKARERLSELRTLSAPLGIEVRMLNRHPMHIRVFANQVVDYWPATSRAWVVGSAGNGQILSLSEVIGLAMSAHGTLDAEFREVVRTD